MDGSLSNRPIRPSFTEVGGRARRKVFEGTKSRIPCPVKPMNHLDGQIVPVKPLSYSQNYSI